MRGRLEEQEEEAPPRFDTADSDRENGGGGAAAALHVAEVAVLLLPENGVDEVEASPCPACRFHCVWGRGEKGCTVVAVSVAVVAAAAAAASSEVVWLCYCSWSRDGAAAPGTVRSCARDEAAQEGALGSRGAALWGSSRSRRRRPRPRRACATAASRETPRSEPEVQRCVAAVDDDDGDDEAVEATPAAGAGVSEGATTPGKTGCFQRRC